MRDRLRARARYATFSAMKQLTIVNDVAAGADVRALLEKAGVAAGPGVC